MNEALQEFRRALAGGSYGIAQLKLASWMRALDAELSACGNDDSRRELIAGTLDPILQSRIVALMGRAQLLAELDRLPRGLPYSPTASLSTWTIDG